MPLGSHCPDHILYSVWEPALKNTCSSGTWSECSLTGRGCAGSKVALPVIQLIPKVFSKQCQIMAGSYWWRLKMILSTDVFLQSIQWPAESLCFCTLILSRQVMTIIWRRLVLPIQLHQKIWVSFWSVTFVNIFIDVKWATECVPVLEKTPLLGCIMRFAYSETF